MIVQATRGSRHVQLLLLSLQTIALASLAQHAAQGALASQKRQDRDQELDNSIRASELLLPAVATSSLAPGEYDHQKVAPVAQLERRVDRLEFELRKSLHELRHSAGRPAGHHDEHLHALESRWSALGERLELVEKFITITTTKMYEQEQRIRQLEKCECRLACKWRPAGADALADAPPPPPGPKTDVHSHLGAADAHLEPAGRRAPTTTTQRLNETIQVKMDGQVWRNKCDVCSCHRGHVRCKRMDCAEPKCDNPQQVPGKCCPVCYRSCMWRNQMVKHGNKLVINSNEDTCKECLCMDGRFKCQRVNLGPADASASSLAAQQSGASNGGSVARSQRSALEENGANNVPDYDDDHDYADYDAGAGAEGDNDADNDNDARYAGLKPHNRPGPPESQNRRPKRRSSSSQDYTNGAGDNFAPLLCPQADCPAGEQFRLQNDCCIYCKGFDFCQNSHSLGRCHPDAICTNANLSQLVVVGSSSGGPAPNTSSRLTIESTYKCQCKSGFTGDGVHQCRDLDECSDERLNDCDPKSTRCTNMAGSYQCKCRPGFRPIAGAELDARSQPIAANRPIAVAGERRVLQKCQDVNECQDGKLNRCHPQAKCINLIGSYKCHCKRGYLGNGFDCHKWFSSDPNVAAYLYRHSAATTGEPAPAANQSAGPVQSASMGAQQLVGGATKGVSMPLDTLDDDDQDDDDPTNASSPIEQDDDDEPMAGAPDLGALPELSESKWEPLRLEAITSQQANNSNEDDDLTAKQTAHHQQQSWPSLNTRTMFFQPPVRLPWPRPWLLDQQHQDDVTRKQQQQQTNKSLSEAQLAGAAQQQQQGSASDTNNNNNPVYIQRLSENIDRQANDPTKRTMLSPSATNQQILTTPRHQIEPTGSLSSSPNGNTPQGYKRGTIIASASTSPKRGLGNGRAYHWQQYKSNHQASAASASVSSSSSILNRPNHLKQLTLTRHMADMKFSPVNYLVSLLLVILLSLIQLYCIHLNHIVTFYSS